jgi:aryl-alcohol dehydrogenase-like predicted oxidoreductase
LLSAGDVLRALGNGPEYAEAGTYGVAGFGGSERVFHALARPEEEVIPTGEELGIGFVPWSPLSVKFLTGWIGAQTRFAEGDFRRTETRFAPENLPNNLALVELIRSWAERKNATPAQIALAWLMAKKPWIVPIPGTTYKDHMLQNISAAEVRSTEIELAELNDALANIEIRGKRLPDVVQSYSGVEAPNS